MNAIELYFGAFRKAAEKETPPRSAKRDGEDRFRERGKGYHAEKHAARSYEADLDDLLGQSSHLDRPIRITTFPTQAAQSKRERTLSLRQLARLVRETKAETKEKLPWLKGAIFGDVRTEKNSLRHNANVRSISGIEIDYDAGAISPENARDSLSKAGLTGLVYTTPSDRPGKPRWRAFLPTSKHLPPERRTALVERLNGLFGGTIDGASFTLSQSFYFGGTGDGTPVKTYLVEGRRWIDQAADLDATALPKGARREGEGDITDAPDSSGSGALFRLAVGLKRSGSTFEEFEEAVREDAAAFAHVEREERTARGRGQRAIERAWARAPEAEPIEFLDLGPDPDAEKPGRLKFLSPGECADAPPRGYVVKGLLAPRDVGCIFGAPGAGKSLIAPYLAYAVAQGNPAFGLRTKRGPVFYVAAEDPHGMRGRITALREMHGDAPDFHLVEGLTDLLTKGAQDLAELRRAVKDLRPSLIIIDTLAMSFPGLEENSAEGMGRVVAVARKLTEHGAAVLLIHHSTKASDGTPRGHSLLNGALDMAIELQARDETWIIRGKLTKNRNGSCDLEPAFRIGTVERGVDEDGDPISFAYCDAIAGKVSTSAPREKLTAGEKAALDILREMGGQADSVSESAWRSRCVECRAISASEDIESRRRTVRRIVSSLARKQRVAFAHGRIELLGLHSPLDEAEIFNLDELERE